MNLRIIQEILTSIDWDSSELQFRRINQSTVEAGNINNFKEFLEKSRLVPLCNIYRDILVNSRIFRTSLNDLLLSESDFQKISGPASQIYEQFYALGKILTELLPHQENDSVTIKIPEPSDFEEAIKFQSEFFMAISQNIVNETIGGRVILKEWEPGSFWLTLYLATPLAVGLVGGMAWAATVVFKKYQEAKMFEQMVKGLKIKNDSMEELKVGMRHAVDLLLESEAKKLFEKNYKKTSDPEQEARLRLGIKTFMELIDKGAEIHPSLKAPTSVKELFPDFSQLSFSDSKTKQIEDSTSKNKADN